MRNKGALLPRSCLVLACAFSAASALQDLTGIPLHMSAALAASDPARRVVVVRDSRAAWLAARKDTGPVPAKTFARQVAMLSQDARRVDVLWSTFVRDCDVQPFNQNDGRSWFGLWDGRVLADYSSGSCRDLFNRIVEAGELIKQGMVGAEEAARKALSPGEIREIRRSHLMEWNGWALAPPARREP